MTRANIVRNIINDDGYYYTKHSVLEIVNVIFDEHEAQLKAKDEEIKVLECRAYHAEGYISDLHNNPKDKKFYDKKARSIVAMLFWGWREYKRRGENWEDESKAYEQSFNKAYAMIKDNA